MITCAIIGVPVRTGKKWYTYFCPKETETTTERNEMKNKEGYPDPTAAMALQRISLERGENEKVIRLCRMLRDMAGMAGCELLSELVLQERRSGRIYRQAGRRRITGKEEKQ